MSVLLGHNLMVKLIYGVDVQEGLRTLEESSVNCVITSPPYWGLRDYGVVGQLGLEPSPGEYVKRMVGVFRDVKRVLRTDGTVWLNLGDSYAGHHGNSRVPDDQAPSNKAGYVENMRTSTVGIDGLKPKDLVGIPWRVVFALQDDGWYLRAAIPWVKRNVMPAAVRDRPTTGVEYVFLLSHPDSKGRYYYDMDAARVPSQTKPQRRLTTRKFHSKGGEIAPGAKLQPPHYQLLPEPGIACVPEGGRNRRDTDWFFDSLREVVEGGEGLLHDEDGNPLAFVINPTGFKGAHFAVMPPKLVEPMVKVGCPAGGIVLDPFSGSGTTGMIATQLGRSYVGIDLNESYRNIAESRIAGLPQDRGILDMFGEHNK